MPSDADAVTGAQRDPTQLDLTSHIRSRIKRRGLGKWSACACVVVPSPSRPRYLTREYREQGESDARGGHRVQGVKDIGTRGVQGRRGRKESKSWNEIGRRISGLGIDTRVIERQTVKRGVIAKGRGAVKCSWKRKEIPSRRSRRDSLPPPPPPSLLLLLLLLL